MDSNDKILELLFHKDSSKRAVAVMELMEIGRKEPLPQSTFDTWKKAALNI